MALRSYSRIKTTGTIFLFLLLLPTITWGAEAPNFIPLVGIPYIEGDEVQSFGDYVNAFYFAAISIAAFLAVVKIIFAGVKYMLSDIVTTKQDAKKDIRTALFGLLIVVGAVLILNTINTNLTNITLFADAPVPEIGLEGGDNDTDDLSTMERCTQADSCVLLACTPGPTQCNAERERCRARLNGTPAFVGGQPTPTIACFGTENEGDDATTEEDETEARSDETLLGRIPCVRENVFEYNCEGAEAACLRDTTNEGYGGTRTAEDPNSGMFVSCFGPE